jgi:hypothetical protein
MNRFGNRTTRPRRAGSLFALCLAATLASLTLTQCRQTQDSITGVDLSAPSDLRSRSQCRSQCDRDYRRAVIEEDRRYRQARRECHWDWDCRRDAAREHLRTLAKIRAERRECKRTCYNEGAGSGGR